MKNLTLQQKVFVYSLISTFFIINIARIDTIKDELFGYVGFATGIQKSEIEIIK